MVVGGVDDLLDKHLRNVSTLLDPDDSTIARNETSVAFQEIERYLGDQLLLHSAALVLGVVALLFAKRFPQVLAAVAAMALGLWVTLLVHEQQLHQGFLPEEGDWVPISAGIVAAIAAVALALFLWRVSLAALTGGLLVLLVVAICRLFNTSPEVLLKSGGDLLSAYHIVGAVIVVVVIFLVAWLTKWFYKGMASFASAHIGVLLVLSGLSYLLQHAGDDEADPAFSLLEDLATIWTEVRKGKCSEAALHQPDPECDCDASCRVEISAWIISAWVVILVRYLRDKDKLPCQRKELKEEEAALSKQSPAPPQVVGQPAD